VPVHDELRDGIHHGGDGVSRECGEVSEKRLKAVCREADRRKRQGGLARPIRWIRSRMSALILGWSGLDAVTTAFRRKLRCQPRYR
jgi:hypothetical protein